MCKAVNNSSLWSDIYALFGRMVSRDLFFILPCPLALKLKIENVPSLKCGTALPY